MEKDHIPFILTQYCPRNIMCQPPLLDIEQYGSSHRQFMARKLQWWMKIQNINMWLLGTDGHNNIPIKWLSTVASIGHFDQSSNPYFIKKLVQVQMWFPSCSHVLQVFKNLWNIFIFPPCKTLLKFPESLTMTSYSCYSW